MFSTVVMRTEHFMAKYLMEQKFFKNMVYIIALSSGAGSEYRGEGGSFLRANAAICVQWDSHMFPPRSILHLPKPADFTSAPSQDRSRLIHRRTRRQKSGTPQEGRASL